MFSGLFAMLTPDNVFLVVSPVDMRRGIDTLTQYVQNELNAAWHDGAAFVFTNNVNATIFNRYLPFSCPLRYFRY